MNQAPKLAARPSPTTFLSQAGRAKIFVEPARSDVFPFVLLFYEILCIS
jgi:hypothetical protein